MPTGLLHVHHFYLELTARSARAYENVTDDLIIAAIVLAIVSLYHQIG